MLKSIIKRLSELYTYDEIINKKAELIGIQINNHKKHNTSYYSYINFSDYEKLDVFGLKDKLKDKKNQYNNNSSLKIHLTGDYTWKLTTQYGITAYFIENFLHKIELDLVKINKGKHFTVFLLKENSVKIPISDIEVIADNKEHLINNCSLVKVTNVNYKMHIELKYCIKRLIENTNALQKQINIEYQIIENLKYTDEKIIKSMATKLDIITDKHIEVDFKDTSFLDLVKQLYPDCKVETQNHFLLSHLEMVKSSYITAYMSIYYGIHKILIDINKLSEEKEKNIKIIDENNNTYDLYELILLSRMVHSNTNGVVVLEFFNIRVSLMTLPKDEKQYLEIEKRFIK